MALVRADSVITHEAVLLPWEQQEGRDFYLGR